MKAKSLLLSILILVTCFAGTTGLYAADNKYELKREAYFKDVLFERLGKRVSVKTDSGEAIEGTVTSVGTNLVHLSKISGKDFYDAVISIDKINSLVFKVRDN